MSLTVTTNLPSLICQRNLNSATNALNQSIERMSTGYKINHASDNAAGYSIMDSWTAKLSSLDVAQENISMGCDLLTTEEDSCALIVSHLQRIRDLTEQAANGTYGTTSKTAMKTEIEARIAEINRVQANCEYNGIKLMSGAGTEIKFQVGIMADSNSQITMKADLSKQIDISSINATTCTGTNTECTSMITAIDNVLKTVDARITDVGSLSNRLESALEAASIQSENITSSLSTIRDTDVSEESSNYVQQQILQQATATLLATANQTPSIALNLI